MQISLWLLLVMMERDTAVDLGRLRQNIDVISSRRALLRTRRHWYSIMNDLHKFMVAVFRLQVNHDGKGGTAPDAMIGDKSGILKPRLSSLRSIVDHASLPGPRGFQDSSWCGLSSSLVIEEDVAVRPYGGVIVLLGFTTFLASLHWPQGVDLGKFGISYLE